MPVRPASVVDASVLAAIVFGEPESSRAAAMLAGQRLYAPDLLPYELANVAVSKARRHRGKKHEVSKALSDALQLDITLVAVPADMAFSAALETGLTAYDGAYLALSRSLDFPIATLDQELARRAKAEG